MNLKSILIISALAVAAASQGVTLASWNFDSTTVSSTASQGLAAISADSGSGSASAFHTASATVYSTPAGNGSIKSVSSNTWGVGDYYQFTTSTIGYSSISVDFDQTGSGTGPGNFKVQYSTNGTAFTDLTGGAYSLVVSNWNPTTTQPGHSKTFDLGALGGLSTLYVRLTNTSSTTTGSINGAAVGTGGTNRVDNFLITGTTQAVPEPGAFAALGLGAVALLRRRRKA